MTRRPTRNNEAYRLYLLGNSLLARRTQLDVRRALAAYTEAARLDPRFTNAWARISLARSIQYSWSDWDEGVPRDSLLSLSWAAANRALSLDSLSAEARLAVAHAAMQRGDGWIAHAEFERSLALDSLDPDAWHFYGTMYGSDCVPIWYCLDDYERAAPLFRRALMLDPTLRNAWRYLALTARDAGRLADAEALLDTALSFGPWPYARWNRGYVRLARGDAAGALADLSEASGIDPADLRRTRALLAVALGDSTPARLALSGLRESTGADPGATWWKARLAMALGLRGEALEALEGLRRVPIARALLCAPSVPCSAHLATWLALHDPIFAPLRDDARFERLWEETRPRVPWLDGYQRNM